MEYILHLNGRNAFDVQPLFSLFYSGFLNKLWLFQRDMTAQSTKCYDLDYHSGIKSFKISMERLHDARCILKGLMDEDTTFKPKLRDVVITPTDLKFKWGMKDNLLEYSQPLLKVACFIIHANPENHEHSNAGYRRNSENY